MTPAAALARLRSLSAVQLPTVTPEETALLARVSGVTVTVLRTNLNTGEVRKVKIKPNVEVEA